MLSLVTNILELGIYNSKGKKFDSVLDFMGCSYSMVAKKCTIHINLKLGEEKNLNLLQCKQFKLKLNHMIT